MGFAILSQEMKVEKLILLVQDQQAIYDVSCCEQRKQRPHSRHLGVKGEDKGRFAGPIQHCSLKVDCTLVPEIFPSFISRGAPQHAVREASISEGRTLNTRILPAQRNLLQVLGSFTSPKVGTCDRLFNFPSKGRHVEDFYI
jgi:hypothetical protein